MQLLSENLKFLRQRYGFTQKKLGEKVFAKQNTINAWENMNIEPSAEKLVLLSELYNISIDKMLKQKIEY
jgi:transcriptional regulator with XRE-family HTH domain